MKALFVDLASQNGLLACVTADAVVAKTEIHHRISDAELLPLLEKTVRDAGWSMHDLTQIACVTGPGGFTSIRTGVSLANALAWGLAVPVSGLHLRDLWTARTKEKDGVWLHSTKKELIFVGHGKEEPVPTALPAFLETVSAGTLYTGELIPDHEEAIKKKEAKRAEAVAVEEILPSLLKTLPAGGKTLEPWYGRSW